MVGAMQLQITALCDAVERMSAGAAAAQSSGLDKAR